MTCRSICKEFYQFFLKHENLPDGELSDKVVVEFAGINYVRARDLVQATRNARKVSNDLVERIKK